MKSYRKYWLIFWEVWWCFRADRIRCWLFYRSLCCELAGRCIKAFNCFEPMYQFLFLGLFLVCVVLHLTVLFIILETLFLLSAIIIIIFIYYLTAATVYFRCCSQWLYSPKDESLFFFLNQMHKTLQCRHIYQIQEWLPVKRMMWFIKRHRETKQGSKLRIYIYTYIYIYISVVCFWNYGTMPTHKRHCSL